MNFIFTGLEIIKQNPKLFAVGFFMGYICRTLSIKIDRGNGGNKILLWILYSFVSISIIISLLGCRNTWYWSSAFLGIIPGWFLAAGHGTYIEWFLSVTFGSLKNNQVKQMLKVASIFAGLYITFFSLATTRFEFRNESTNRQFDTIMALWKYDKRNAIPLFGILQNREVNVEPNPYDPRTWIKEEPHEYRRVLQRLIENTATSTLLANNDLSYTHLLSARLEGANLEGAKLNEADFRFASLKGANLKRAVARETNFEYAYLSGTDFEGADLRGSNFGWAYFKETNLKWALLNNAHLGFFDSSWENADFENSNWWTMDGLTEPQKSFLLKKFQCTSQFMDEFREFWWSRVFEIEKLSSDELKECPDWVRRKNYKETNLEYADLRGDNLANVNLTRANLEGADLRGSNLTGADLTDAILTVAHLQMANFEGANLKRTKLGGANLFEAKFSKANLSGVDFRMAYLKETYLEEAYNWKEACFENSNWWMAHLTKEQKEYISNKIPCTPETIAKIKETWKNHFHINEVEECPNWAKLKDDHSENQD